MKKTNMELPDNLLQYVREEARRLGQHGQIIIKPGNKENKIFVISTQSRLFTVTDDELIEEDSSERKTVFRVDPS